MTRTSFRMAGLAGALALSLAATALSAQSAREPGETAPPRAMQVLTPSTPAILRVTTPGWAAGGDIPFENTQYAGNVFPGLSWSAGPAATKSYAIIMQDTDGSRDGKPAIFLHWTMYNIPGNVTSLPTGMIAEGRPNGSAYGPNYRGDAQPYLGPRTPSGPVHHYHLQVFALDAVLPVAEKLTLEQLLDNMKGHVLASGEVVGLGRSPYPPAP